MTDPGTSNSTLDSAVIASLKELGGDDDQSLFLELIDLFVQDSREHLTSLARALEQGDVRNLERVAHTLKSSCANLGAMTMSRLCHELEKHGRAGDMQGVGELLARTNAEYEEVKQALEAAKP